MRIKYEPLIKKLKNVIELDGAILELASDEY